MTLEQLSAAATQGEWVADNHVIMLSPATTVACLENFNQWGDSKPTSNEANDAVFICALVNAYRTGQLVAVQPDDATVERVKDAIGTSLAYDIGMDVRAGSLTDDEKRKVARKAIAAMEGPKP